MAAIRVAEYVCSSSQHGVVGEQGATSEIQDALKMSPEQLHAAVVDLVRRGYLTREPDATRTDCPELVALTLKLFEHFDPTVMSTAPRRDAVDLAREVLKHPNGVLLEDLLKVLGWPGRRLNPACAFLIERGALEPSDTNISCGRVVANRVHPTGATRFSC